MLNILVLTIATTVGILCTVIIIKKNKKNKFSLINRYLIALLTIAVIRFLFNGLSLLYPTENLLQFTSIVNIFVIFGIPCFYLYFQDIIFENKFKLKQLYHFILPVLLIIIFIIFLVPKKITHATHILEKIFFISCFLYNFTYVFFAFILLYKNVWRRKSDIKTIQAQNDLINYWTLYMFSCLMVLSFSRLFTWIFLHNLVILDNLYISIPALIWIIIFVKIVLTPEILYGFNLLTDTIDKATTDIILKPLWNVKGNMQPDNSEKDQKLAEKIAASLSTQIHKIDELSFNSAIFRNAALTIEDLANALALPTSHVSHIFKYHCNETFTDYKKVVRIHDASKMLDKGYLNENTIESLAGLVGFTSYHTFYVAFKSITGTTTQNYVKRI